MRSKKCQTGYLQASELQATENSILRWQQRQIYGQEYKQLQLGKALSRGSAIYDLDPYLDCENLLRVRGRLDTAPLSEDTQCNIP